MKSHLTEVLHTENSQYIKQLEKAILQVNAADKKHLNGLKDSNLSWVTEKIKWYTTKIDESSPDDPNKEYYQELLDRLNVIRDNLNMDITDLRCFVEFQNEKKEYDQRILQLTELNKSMEEAQTRCALALADKKNICTPELDTLQKKCQQDIHKETTKNELLQKEKTKNELLLKEKDKYNQKLEQEMQLCQKLSQKEKDQYNEMLEKQKQEQTEAIAANNILWDSVIHDANDNDETTRKHYREQINTLTQQNQNLRQTNSDDKESCTSYKTFTYVVFFFISVICIIYAIYRYRTV